MLGQEVRLQRGEACEFKSWIELGSNISHGKHPLSQLYMFLPVDLFIGCELDGKIVFPDSMFTCILNQYLGAYNKRSNFRSIHMACEVILLAEFRTILTSISKTQDSYRELHHREEAKSTGTTGYAIIKVKY